MAGKGEVRFGDLKPGVVFQVGSKVYAKVDRPSVPYNAASEQYNQFACLDDDEVVQVVQ
jgi:hypothetical protein